MFSDNFILFLIRKTRNTINHIKPRKLGSNLSWNIQVLLMFNLQEKSNSSIKKFIDKLKKSLNI